jgi:type I restriction-modification system DNA methylase subunit
MTKRTANVATSVNLGFEAQLWPTANALRGSMDAAEYKHVVLGLIFLKYISDVFEAHHAKLEAERAQGAEPEDPDEYRAENISWVPPEARWSRNFRRMPASRPSASWWANAKAHRLERSLSRSMEDKKWSPPDQAK